MESDFIYLASSSPRRKQLLDQIGVAYRVQPVNVDERQRSGEAPEMCVLRLALDKARAGWRAIPSDQRRPVLAADTAVVIDGQMLGKPKDQQHGLAMLAQLSGRVHMVMTGVALVGEREDSRLSITKVLFRVTSAAEREAYWATGEPCDKAGAYAIQGRAAVFVTHIDGSYSGVMGLPLFETFELLRELDLLTK